MRTIFTLFLLFICYTSRSVSSDELPYLIPVVVVKYFPIHGDNIDIEKTGDWGKELVFTQKKVDSITVELTKLLGNASCYRGYKNPDAKPSIKYEIVGTFEFYEPMPTVRGTHLAPPMTDYNTIIQRIDGKDWIENRGVKEIWVWGYHGGKVGLWESNMAGPYGDISNSDRALDDLPIFSKTFTLFHYNYQRGLSEAIENHMHQIEALLNFVDGRDSTDEDKWSELLFWGKFVGSDKSHKIIRPGCGWAHYPPNGEKDYDWANKKYVDTDIEDWKPDGTGTKQNMNCERWKCNSLSWFQYWMQNLPGYNSGLSCEGKPLTNWWIFVGDFDTAMKNGMKLTAP
ncbi:MAG: hypothetical protein ABIJ65_15265 [Chloroflexota bacterium]